jgi:hypothetical protein
MNYWIFVVTSRPEYGLTGTDIYDRRMLDRFWGLGERTPNRRALEAGDQVVFYVGNPVKSFLGTASIPGEAFRLNQEQREIFSHGIEFYRPEYGIFLSDIETWSEPRTVELLVDNLSFIENKLAWGVYFQGGVRGISEEDYQIIIGDRQPSLVEQLISTKDLEDQSEFALESHLEEFIFSNWASINFHAKLRRYETDGQNGRQFPAGKWSIDFLCIDDETNDFVVVELKRGKTSDAVVGQLLRYIGWVKENLATDGQGVRGVIIAGEAEDALRYAVKAVPSITVLTYRVSFSLATI